MVRKCLQYLTDGNERQCIGVSLCPLSEVLIKSNRLEEVEQRSSFLINNEFAYHSCVLPMLHEMQGAVAASRKKYKEAIECYKQAINSAKERNEFFWEMLINYRFLLVLIQGDKKSEAAGVKEELKRSFAKFAKYKQYPLFTEIEQLLIQLVQIC